MNKLIDATTDERFALFWQQSADVVSWVQRILLDRKSTEHCPGCVPYCRHTIRDLADVIDKLEATPAITISARTIAGRQIPEHVSIVDGHRRAFIRKALGLPVWVQLD